MSFDPFNPPQMAQEDCLIEGCTCGSGSRWHTATCAFWTLSLDAQRDALSALSARQQAHLDLLHGLLREWEAEHGRIIGLG